MTDVHANCVDAESYRAEVDRLHALITKQQNALELMRSLSINPMIPDGFRVMMRESLDR